MRSLFQAAFVALLFVSLNPFVARAEDTPSLHSLEATNSAWSTVAYLHGTGKQSGVGLGFQTPLLWETLGLRVDYSFDRLGIPGNDPLTFSVLSAGVKIQLAKASTLNLFPYLLENFNFFFPREAETTGSTVGFETCYGLEFRHIIEIWGNRDVVHAGFIEVGLGASDLRARAERGGDSINDGLIARLGFRRFF